MECMCVCVCKWEGDGGGEEMEDSGKGVIFSRSVLLLFPLISVSLSSTLHYILSQIDRAVLIMDACPVARSLSQLTYRQHYILDEAMKHLP